MLTGVVFRMTLVSVSDSGICWIGEFNTELFSDICNQLYLCDPVWWYIVRFPTYLSIFQIQTFAKLLVVIFPLSDNIYFPRDYFFW